VTLQRRLVAVMALLLVIGLVIADIVTYAEVEFLKAEAEERGWVTGTPAVDYALGQAAASPRSEHRREFE